MTQTLQRETAPIVARQGQNGDVIISREDPRDIIKAMLAINARNKKIARTAQEWAEKGDDSRRLALIYAREFGGDGIGGRRREILDFPLADAIKAADYTDPSNEVGTLSGTLVAQRTLELFKLEMPAIGLITTDFSDLPGQFQQTEVTRRVILPGMQTYSATKGADGRPQGWNQASPAVTLDAPVTLSAHVGVPLVFDSNILASTSRRLFEESAPAAAATIAEYLSNLIYGLLLPASFNAFSINSLANCTTTNGSSVVTVASTTGLYQGAIVSGAGIPAGATVIAITPNTSFTMSAAATASATVALGINAGRLPQTYTTFAVAQADFSRASLSAISGIFNPLRVPKFGRFALLSSAYHQQLANDPTLVTFRTAPVSADYITDNVLPRMSGFTPLEAPNLADNNATAHLVGFAAQKSALIVKARPSGDYSSVLPDANYGSVTTVTNPDFGISMTLVQYVNHTQGYAEWRLQVMLGTAVGDPRAGLVITSQ